tara:strand:- start:186 stop:1466 length:1281 start_codon:yes stop_codon:yes gene_type:complete
MISYIRKFYSDISQIEKISFSLFAFFPISLILGNLAINLNLILIAFTFLIDLKIEKNLSFLKDKIFWLLIIFFLSLIPSLIFSVDHINSFPRVLKILLIIPFILLIKKNITNHEVQFEKGIFGIWSIVILITTLDVIFEIIFGYNIFGYSANSLGYYSDVEGAIKGRIASFFGEELVVGGFLGAFSLIGIGYLMKFHGKYKKIIIMSALVLITTSFLIGERSNFIKFFIPALIILFFFIKLNFKSKLTLSFLILLIIFISYNFNTLSKNRYHYLVNLIVEKDAISNYLKKSQYGAHYDTAYSIFKDNKLFGVGLKNFRNECSKEKYLNSEFERSKHRCATHPHQIHFEILSETGILGYLSFLVFIIISIYLSLRAYVEKKNIFQLMSILYVATFLIPMLPSGSFFSTFYSGLFWINYGIMVSYIKK